MSELDGGRITTRDLLDRIDRLDAKLTNEFNSKFNDHESRIRKNEDSRTQMLTIAGIISLSMSLFAAEIKSRIFGS